MVALALVLLFFAVVHSATARPASKAWVGRVWPKAEQYYRLAYHAVSVATFLPALVLAVQPSLIVWQVELPLAAGLYALRLSAAVGVGVALVQIDWLTFMGLRTQVAGVPHLRQLTDWGLYRWVRHPLYLFSIVFLLATPLMTQRWLLFSGGCALYFVVGSYFEERKLVAHFGSSYRAYQERVFWFFPGRWVRG